MGQYLKIVFSTTRHKTSWGNTRFVQENVLETVREIKSMRGKDVFVFGSSDLCKTLIKHGLADEFRLMVNPVVLGKGKRLFHERMNWQLLKTKIFGNGNVLLCYRIAG
jgi:dihydrofolate reductase